MANAVIGALRVNLGLDSAQFQNGLDKAKSGLSNFGAMAKKGLMVVGAAAAAATAGMAMAVKGTINAADEMSKAAQKIGIPTEELSRLKYAADLSGVSFGSLQTGVRTLSKAMANLTDSNSPAVAALEQMGINARDAAGNMRPTSDVMMEMADVFARMPDGAEKTATAVALFGKAGADMIPMLNGGSEALRGLMAEADQFGQVFTTEMGQQAEVFNDNISRLQGVFGSLAAKLAQELLPHLESFTNWLVENAPAIIDFTVRFANNLATFAKVIVDVASGIHSFVTGAATQFAAAWDAMVSKVDAVKASIEQFTRDFLAAFQALPGQMYEIGANVMQGLWDGLKSMGSSVIEGAKGLGASVIGGFKGAFQTRSPSKVMHGIGVNVMQGLGDGMSSMQDGVMSIGESIASTLTSAFMGIIDGSQKVSDVLKNLLKQVASMVLSKAFTSLFGGLFGGGLGRLFGGFRANGGPVRSGRAYVVGERGPELMVPNASGTVIPNSALSEGRREIVVTLVGEEGRMFVPRVQQISGQTAGVVVREASPGIVNSSINAVQSNMRNRPSFAR